MSDIVFSLASPSNDMVYNKSTLTSMMRVLMHMHEGYEIFRYLSDSPCTYMVEETVYELCHGDIIVTNNRELHSLNLDNVYPYERQAYMFTPAFLSEFQSGEYDLFSFMENRQSGTFNKIPAHTAQSIGLSALMDEIDSWARKDIPDKFWIIKAITMQLLMVLNSLYPDFRVHAAYKSDKLIEIMRYINDHAAEDISLDSLEKRFFLNKYYICHLFKKSAGITVNEYILRKRVVVARRLIGNGYQMSRAAIESGFSDYSVFYKAFRKYTGISPSEYKKKYVRREIYY